MTKLATTKMVTTELDVDINLMRTVRVKVTHKEGANPLDLFAKDNYSPESYEARNDVLWKAEHATAYEYCVTDMGFEIVGVRKAE